MSWTNFHQANLCEAVEARCAHTLESSTNNPRARCTLGSIRGKSREFAYKAIMSLAVAHPMENPTKTTQETTSIFRRPYISLSLARQTAKPSLGLVVIRQTKSCKGLTHVGKKVG